jgi:hypothetical protein
MSAAATIYRMWANGTWNHPTLPAINPEPVDPQPQGDLWFGTLLVGQSYANYKKFTISGEAARYRQIEYDTIHDLGGTLGTKRGSAAIRSFGPTSGIGTWTSMTGGDIRATQPIIYSWKDGGNHDGSSESVFKQEFRDWMDSRPVGSSTRVWLAYAHEFDNDGYPSEASPTLFNGKSATGVGMERWYDRNIWVWEVLQEAAYDQNWARNGGWLKFGWITTGSPYQHGKPNTDSRSWRRYIEEMCNRINATVPALSGITPATIGDFWDYHGCDKYNPSWDGNDATRYMTWANWSLKFSQAYDLTGLPIVIAEAGSARDTRTGITVANKDAERAAWLQNQYQSMKDAGYYDVVTYWRVPSVKPSNSVQDQYDKPFSTNMITPTGYNAECAASQYGPGLIGGTGSDAQAVCDVHNEWCLQTIADANSLGVGPPITYYTGGPA